VRAAGVRAAARAGGVWFLRSKIEEVKNAQRKSEIYRSGVCRYFLNS